MNDADIAAGSLLNPYGSPKYPILISLASEAIADSEVVALRAYVNAGGHSDAKEHMLYTEILTLHE